MAHILILLVGWQQKSLLTIVVQHGSMYFIHNTIIIVTIIITSHLIKNVSSVLLLIPSLSIQNIRAHRHGVGMTTVTRMHSDIRFATPGASAHYRGEANDSRAEGMTSGGFAITPSIDRVI
ncbi:hypothetical protein SCHPADRAFT_977833 [Schizopora paradoxa]|uniref:Uncharacterized protein n=1 Tax=Schizopora paradoxa TaxID=27342 RepID=A0A0H2RZT8_9AGAM|nr:hypothetical protein SCHPADRAFT_977833 [Schizopora paradoxa]